MRLVEPTLKHLAVRRPRPKRGRRRQLFCGDKGYDYPDVRALLRPFGCTLHIKSRGEDGRERRSNPRYRARRWVVERSHSSMNRFRQLLSRWEKKAINDETFLHLACAWTFREAGVIG
jgi:hypothetical protein